MSPPEAETASLPMRRPLVPVAAALALGIAGAERIPMTTTAALLAAGVLVAAALLLKGRLAGEWRALLYLAAVAVLGLAHGRLPAPLPEPPFERGILVATASGAWEHRAGYSRLLVRAEALGDPRAHLVPVAATVRLSAGRPAGGACPPVWPGDRLRLPVRIHRPRGRRNPGGPDWARQLQRQGIDWLARLDDCRRVLVEAPPAAPGPAAWLVQARRRLLALFTATGGAGGPLVAAMVSGHRGAIAPRLQEDFRRAGLAHLLAVSGLHLGLVALGGYLLLRLLLGRITWLARRWHSGRLAALACLPLVTGYALLAGCGLPVLRALVMTTVFLLATWWGRLGDGLNSLAAAALIILVAWPQALFAPGFQLSFCTVAGLLWGVGPLCRHLGLVIGPGEQAPWYRRLGVRLGQYLVVSLLATVFSAPLTAWHFNQLAPAGLLLNLVAVPLVGWWMVPLGLLAAVCLPLSGTLAAWLAGLAALPGGWLAALAGTAADWSGELGTVAPPAWWQLLLVYPALLLVLRAGSRRWQLLGGMLLLLVVAGALAPRWLVPRPPGLRATVMDVGQGDAILVQMPSGFSLLVDGGPAGRHGFDSGRRVVARVLWQRGLRRLDAVALSHAQADHAGGLPSLLAIFRPRQLWVGEPLRDSDLGRRLARQCRRLGIEVIELRAGQVPHREPGCRVETLWPPGQEAGLDRNESSLVLRAGCGGQSLLLTGDLERAGERALLAAGGELHSQVLKVGHHGSAGATSQQLLERVRPRHAIISVGARNPHHLPHPRVLERLRRAGVRIWRTDRQGAVTATLGPGGWQVQAQLP